MHTMSDRQWTVAATFGPPVTVRPTFDAARDFDRLYQALADLIEWDATTGFHEGQCWGRARAVQRLIQMRRART